LVTAKVEDFLIFKSCFEMIKKGEHLTEEGLLKIISLKSALNLGLPEKLINAFSRQIDSLVPVVKREYVFKYIPDPY
jgi:hypothetical protein